MGAPICRGSELAFARRATTFRFRDAGATDECVEVTPEVVRVRKVELDATTRARSTAWAKARG